MPLKYETNKQTGAFTFCPPPCRAAYRAPALPDESASVSAAASKPGLLFSSRLLLRPLICPPLLQLRRVSRRCKYLTPGRARSSAKACRFTCCIFPPGSFARRISRLRLICCCERQCTPFRFLPAPRCRAFPGFPPYCRISSAASNSFAAFLLDVCLNFNVISCCITCITMHHTPLFFCFFLFFPTRPRPDFAAVSLIDASRGDVSPAAEFQQAADACPDYSEADFSAAVKSEPCDIFGGGGTRRSCRYLLGSHLSRFLGPRLRYGPTPNAGVHLSRRNASICLLLTLLSAIPSTDLPPPPCLLLSSHLLLIVLLLLRMPPHLRECI